MSAQLQRRPRRRWLLGSLALVVLAVGVTAPPGVRRGLADPANRAPVIGVTTVEVRDDILEYFAFTPSVIEVPVGTEVTWDFTSGTEHNVVFDANSFSPNLEAGAQWSRTFDAPGDHAYSCTLHEGMDGRVIVR